MENHENKKKVMRIRFKVLQEGGKVLLMGRVLACYAQGQGFDPQHSQEKRNHSEMPSLYITFKVQMRKPRGCT